MALIFGDDDFRKYCSSNLPQRTTQQEWYLELCQYHFIAKKLMEEFDVHERQADLFQQQLFLEEINKSDYRS